MFFLFLVGFMCNSWLSKSAKCPFQKQIRQNKLNSAQIPLSSRWINQSSDGFLKCVKFQGTPDFTAGNESHRDRDGRWVSMYRLVVNTSKYTYKQPLTPILQSSAFEAKTTRHSRRQLCKRGTLVLKRGEFGHEFCYCSKIKERN